MDRDQTAPNDLGPYCLQYMLPKGTREQTILVAKGVKRVS